MLRIELKEMFCGPESLRSENIYEHLSLDVFEAEHWFGISLHSYSSNKVPADPLVAIFFGEVADIPPVVLDSDAYEVVMYVLAIFFTPSRKLQSPTVKLPDQP